ncbi:AmmeMemoRadiSam system protein B [Seongchinamella sediminis]|uniref:MEMO1 family protein DWB85_07435 n=1 Tax=Seongchinamella sediminis TaxID=2283635 RepID=A0A3L7E283_9GAMM|nr:AmmeMemoRadiSam system protein B [Seongchinamella sediminis]RLQ22443.1 AmmeMemoRadiSam system protein B [Seongchinamella sediminis]
MNLRPDVRPPAVAGSFYPADAAQLQHDVATLLAQAPPPAPPPPRALIVPHAGYIYSGATAAAAYRQLESRADSVHRVILLGPAHRVYLQGMAVPSTSAFATPLGDVPLDLGGIAQALALPGVCRNDEAHRQEHALEVQLPFLQCVLGDFTLLPVVVGDCPAATVATLVDSLWRDPGTLLVVSSDLSHFQPSDSARRHDLDSCRRILAGDCELRGSDACGARPINGLLASARGGTLQRQLLDYRNSADAGGDRQRVVGYGAFSLH